MSMLDPRLDALLADVPAPPLPDGLAERIKAAAMAAAQEPHPGRARRAAQARRDRRGQWRRALVIGVGSIGLAVSSAVAATLAGVPLPAKVEAVIAQLPLIGREKAVEREIEAPARPRPVRQAAATVASLPPAIEPVPPAWKEIRQERREAVRQIVAARRAAGLPTPRADRMERRIERRAERWRTATPEQRQRWLEVRRQRMEMRRARIEARRDAIRPLPPPSILVPQEPARSEALAVRPQPVGPVYGPVDPRTIRPPANSDQSQRLRNLRAQRLEQLRQQRLEREGLPTTTRPVPTTRRPDARPAPRPTRPTPRSEGLRPPTR